MWDRSSVTIQDDTLRLHFPDILILGGTWTTSSTFMFACCLYRLEFMSRSVREIVHPKDEDREALLVIEDVLEERYGISRYAYDGIPRAGTHDVVQRYVRLVEPQPSAIGADDAQLTALRAQLSPPRWQTWRGAPWSVADDADPVGLNSLIVERLHVGAREAIELRRPASVYVRGSAQIVGHGGVIAPPLTFSIQCAENESVNLRVNDNIPTPADAYQLRVTMVLKPPGFRQP